jgi:hypothetical protein
VSRNPPEAIREEANFTDNVTLAAPDADPDSITLGPAEMAIDPTGPRSPTVNGRPLYLDSRTADRRANRVWKLRRMAVPEWDALCRVGPGHWLGAGLPLASEKNLRASGEKQPERAAGRRRQPAPLRVAHVPDGHRDRLGHRPGQAGSCRDGGLARRQPLAARSRPGRGAHGHGQEHFYQRRLEPGLSLTRRPALPAGHQVRPRSSARPLTSGSGTAASRPPWRRRAPVWSGISAPPLCRDRWLRGN